MSSTWADLEMLSTDTPTCITWASRGDDGSGKSYFSSTAPGPIYVAAFDPHGMSRVDPAIREGKEIRIGRYGFAHLKVEDDRNKIKASARAIWDRFCEDYQTALKHVRTCLWDREDLAWELLRYGSFGGEKNEGSRTGQLDYGDLNAEYVGLIQMAKDAGVNLGLLQGLTDKWVSKFDPGTARMKSYNTGERIADGFKKIGDHVDISLTHSWSPEQKEYMTRIGKFPSKDWKDQEFPNLTFPMMATLAYSSTSEEDWS